MVSAMKTLVVLAVLTSVCSAIDDCPNSLCHDPRAKHNQLFRLSEEHPYYYVQCSNGYAHCRKCAEHLVFNDKFQTCMPNFESKDDDDDKTTTEMTTTTTTTKRPCFGYDCDDDDHKPHNPHRRRSTTTTTTTEKPCFGYDCDDQKPHNPHRRRTTTTTTTEKPCFGYDCDDDDDKPHNPHRRRSTTTTTTTKKPCFGYDCEDDEDDHKPHEMTTEDPHADKNDVEDDCPNSLCDDDDHLGVLLEVPGKPTYFAQCVNSIAFCTMCAPGTVFNKEKQYCDFPPKNGGGKTTTTSTTTTTTTTRKPHQQRRCKGRYCRHHFQNPHH